MKKKLISCVFSSFLLVSCSNFDVFNSNSSNENSSDTSSTTYESSNENSNLSESSSESSSSKKEELSNNSSSSYIIDNSSSSSKENDLPPISYVQVFAPITYTHVYAWLNTSNGVNELCGRWPGTTLKPFDNEWKTHDFQGHSEVNVIFSTGSNANQTKDLYVNEAGYYWYFDGDLHNYKPGESNNNNNDNNGTPSHPDLPSYEADSWRDFKFWNEYDSNYWTTINKYNGDRKDFRNESIYFTITTRFYDGDSSNNVDCWDGSNSDSDPAWRGDFKGLIERMDYIKALGFTAIWITPVVENCSGYDYHGYHALNFQKVDPRYESQDVDFQDVINEAHKRDMKIVLDVVFNHTGNFGESNLFPMFEKEGDLSTYKCIKKLVL